MTTSLVAQWSLPVWAVLVALAVVIVAGGWLLFAVARSARRDADARIETAEARAAAMQQRLDDLEKRVEAQRAAAPVPPEPANASAVRDEREFVITSLAEQQQSAPVRSSAATPSVADQVVREAVVQTAALAQGVRRALSPEVRNRIRFEMKREVKRNRKARKSEVKEALREYRARHRAETAVREEVSA